MLDLCEADARFAISWNTLDSTRLRNQSFDPITANRH